jgi:hypothetical protein
MGCAGKEDFFGKREAFESLRIIENFREKSCWRRQARFRDGGMSFPERNDFREVLKTPFCSPFDFREEFFEEKT